MINTIINTFKDLARKHKLIKSFYYDKTYELGEGNELHPMFWLEEPIYATNTGNNGQGFYVTVSFSILLIPNEDRNEQRCQELALSAGLNIIEKIKRDEDSPVTVKPDWSWVTVSDYYDNNASGIRFTVNMFIPNISNWCVLDEQFDDDKEFEVKEPLNDFDVNPNSKCEVFTNKPLDFDLKIKRR